MQFLLVDVGATLVFVLGYLGIVALQRRRALPVAAAPNSTLSRDPRPRAAGPTIRQPRREWPRLSYPR